MGTLNQTEKSIDENLATPDSAVGWFSVAILVAALCVSGWFYLVAMIVDMIPAMDMNEAGPGMGIFNQFNIFQGLSDEARAAIAVLCLPAGSTFGMPDAALGFFDLGKIFLMWAMMALAMMLPSAMPMLRAYHRYRFADAKNTIVLETCLVIFGYLVVWLGYAALATAAQWGLSKLGALTDMMAPASLALTTSVLIAAGIYQFTPAKSACLRRCWYPKWGFAPFAGQSSTYLAFREGIAQGWICLGCCWAVMTVMFAVGLMNVIWIALLGSVMALEKTFPSRVFPVIIGLFLLSWGGLLAAGMLLGRATG
ncbi:MAG: DUF2182 domain-containing protein [Roseibium sp.]